MKVLYKYLAVCVICVFIGIVIGLLSTKNAWLCLDNTKVYGIWELLYYVFSIIGAIGTVSAVIVALAKETILRMIHHPDINIRFNEEFGISEEIDIEQQNPETETYDCVLKISNVGTVAARSCEVYIDQVSYADKKGKTLHPLKDYQGKSKLWWEASLVEIPAGLSKEIRLFHIDSPNSNVVPGAVPITACYLELNGFKLKDRKAQKGYWEITYYISHDNGEHKHFKLTIDWNGEWKSRKTEMKDVLHVKMEEK